MNHTRYFLAFTEALKTKETSTLIEAIQQGYSALFEQTVFDGKEFGWKDLNPPYNSINLPNPTFWFSVPSGVGPGMRAYYKPGIVSINEVPSIVAELKKHFGMLADELGQDEDDDPNLYYTHDKQGTVVRYNADGSLDLAMPLITFKEGTSRAFFPGAGNLVKDMVAFGMWDNMRQRYTNHSQQPVTQDND